MKIRKEDIERILSKYDLGLLKSFKTIDRRLSSLNPSLIIITTKGKFFLKVYTKQFKRFKYHILKGLDLLIFLKKKKYPSIKVFKAKNKRPYVNYNGVTFAIFEFISLKERKLSTQIQAYELGKNLGRLHKLAIKFPISKTGQGYKSFNKELNKNFYLSKKAPKKYKPALEFLKKDYANLRIPSNQPKSACHVEFTSQHVYFKGNKLVKVIDWDEVSYDYMFYDLGTTMANAFSKNSINFNILSAILRGYKSQRKLTRWESEHLFEAMFFGISKFVIWGLDEEEIQKSGWDKIGLQEIF